MACKGYDPKAVKISKSVKRMADRILDQHKRGEFIRSYVEIEKNSFRGSKKGE